MKKPTFAKLLLLGTSFVAVATSPAFPESFDIPRGDLDTALDAYAVQSGVPIIVSNTAVKGVKTNGVKGDLEPTAALTRLLKGTGFVQTRDAAGVIQIVHQSSQIELPP